MTRFVALAVTALTGFTGLVYQVTWQKYLATLLGSHAEATAAVLGLFLGGMSLGYALFGALTRRLAERALSRGGPSHLLRVYGLVEAAIGAWALLFPWLFAGAERLALALPHAAAGLGFGIDVFLSLLLLGPPTVLMGGTIPFLTQALARSLDDATRLHAFVYAFNTAGAFLGALAAGVVLLHWLGLDGVLAAMGVLNLAAGALFAWLDRRAGTGALLAQRAAVRSVPGFAGYAAVALLVGFAMMTLETILIRIGALSFGSSEFTFAMVVACFVLCIALGSFAVSALPRVPRWTLVVSQCALAALLVGLYFLLPQAPYAAHVLRVLFARVDAAFYPFYVASFLGMLAVLALPVLLSGAALPLLFDHLRHEVGDLGAVAGRIYAWNTVGSLLGALLGGYVLLFWLGLHEVYRVAVAAILLGIAILGVLMFRITRVAAAAVAVVPLGIALIAAPAWNPQHLSMGAFRVRNALAYSFEGHASFIEKWWTENARIAFYRDDPTMSVAVLETEYRGQTVRSLMVNGKPDSATVGDSDTQGLLGLLPALFAETPRRAFVIGYGTGITVGALASLAEIESVEVAEISAGVIEGAPLFDFANGRASSHPKVEIVRSDAYRALLRSDERFDVIVSAPSNPWVTGVEMLYSREFISAARSRLTPGGVYAQWFQQYETQAESVALVLRTYASVFDHVSVWYGSGPDLLLLGFDGVDRALDVERLAQRVGRPDFADALARAEVDGLPGLLAHELLPLGVLHAAGLEGPVHTLYHPLLNYGAARAYFVGDAGELPFTGYGEAARLGARNSLLRRYAAAQGGALPDALRERVLAESCQRRGDQCTTLLAEWVHEDSASEALARALAAAQGRAPDFAGSVHPRRVLDLAEFFGAASAPAPERRAVDAQSAQRVTLAYAGYYQHAAPFDADRLLDVWARCRDGAGAGDACEAGRIAALRLLHR